MVLCIMGFLVIYSYVDIWCHMCYSALIFTLFVELLKIIIIIYYIKSDVSDEMEEKGEETKHVVPYETNCRNET